jgi:D-aminopeptidase
MDGSGPGRSRLRDLGITIGEHPTGPWNAITDVAGIAVGHHTVIRDEPRVARTGVTIIETRAPDDRQHLCYAGISSFNGNGEMTGSHWIAESGLLHGPIGITNTHQVGLVRDVLVEHEVAQQLEEMWCLPLVAETYDGWLNDIDAFHLTADDVRTAIGSARADGPVAEGNVGGGTGMICHGFKGGIGTSSRVVATADDRFTIGVLVQANYGRRSLLRLDGRSIGRAIDGDVVPLPTDPATGNAGSIIIVIATDAPLLADQCQRLARRATIGLARVGGTGSNGSGDIFVAFSTANRVPMTATTAVTVSTLPAGAMTPLFDAAAEAVEEAIWNALCGASTMTGHRGRIVHAIPLDRLTELF